MPERDELFERKIASGILGAMDCGRFEVSADHFMINEEAKAGIDDGLIGRIRKIMHPALFRMFLEYLNEI